MGFHVVTIQECVFLGVFLRMTPMHISWNECRHFEAVSVPTLINWILTRHYNQFRCLFNKYTANKTQYRLTYSSSQKICLIPPFTGAATFVPPLCDHKTGQVAVEGREEADSLPWSLKSGTEDVQTSPWTPCRREVLSMFKTVVQRSPRRSVAHRWLKGGNEECTCIVVVTEWMHRGRPLISP